MHLLMSLEIREIAITSVDAIETTIDRPQLLQIIMAYTDVLFTDWLGIFTIPKLIVIRFLNFTYLL